MLDINEQKNLILEGGDQLAFKRLLFCLEKAGLSVLKLVLLQFKKDTKEHAYLQTLIDQKVFAEDIEKIIPFLFRDRILTCISNFAYSKSQSNNQVNLGDSQAAYEACQKWMLLEDLAMTQIQRIDAEVDANILVVQAKYEQQKRA